MWEKALSYFYQFSYMQNSIIEGFHNARFNPRAPETPNRALPLDHARAPLASTPGG